jgi:hypothetical protein
MLGWMENERSMPRHRSSYLSVPVGFAEGGNEMLLEMLQRLPRKAAKPLLKNKSTVKIVEAIASGLTELTEVSGHARCIQRPCRNKERVGLSCGIRQQGI